MAGSIGHATKWEKELYGLDRDKKEKPEQKVPNRSSLLASNVPKTIKSDREGIFLGGITGHLGCQGQSERVDPTHFATTSAVETSLNEGL